MTGIILNYDMPELTIDCYESLKKINGLDNIWILDNFSSKNKQDILKQYAKKNNLNIYYEEELIENKIDVTKDSIILFEKNYGYSKGNNFGLKLAHKIGEKNCVILNNDVFFKKNDDLEKLFFNFKINKKIALIGPKIINENNSVQIPQKKNISKLILQKIFPPFYSIYYRIKKTKKIEKGILSDRYLSGAVLLIDLSKMNEIGYFDENTFLYCEEAILSERLNIKGYKMYYDDSVEVFHMHEATTKKLARRDKFNYFYSSNKYYLKKYKKWGPLRLFFYYLSQNIYFYLWEPLYKLIKGE